MQFSRPVSLLGRLVAVIIINLLASINTARQQASELKWDTLVCTNARKSNPTIRANELEIEPKLAMKMESQSNWIAHLRVPAN